MQARSSHLPPSSSGHVMLSRVESTEPIAGPQATQSPVFGVSRYEAMARGGRAASSCK